MIYSYRSFSIREPVLTKVGVVEIALRASLKSSNLEIFALYTLFYYMNTPNDQPKPIASLLAAVEADPNNWEARKSAATHLYSEEKFLEAADMVWGAPEMPSIDVDVAFAVKIVSRARPNRSIRLVYEVLRRNSGKAEQNMAMARAFSLIGLPMLASRFYGAALADGSQHFDIGFEQQSLWYDDSGILLETWANTNQDVKPPFSKKIEDFVSDPICCEDLPDNFAQTSTTTSVVNVSKPAGLAGAPVMRAATGNTGPQSVHAAIPPSTPKPAASVAPAPAKPTASQPLRPVVPSPAKPTASQPLKPAVPAPAKPTASQPVKPTAALKPPTPVAKPVVKSVAAPVLKAAKPPVVRPPKPNQGA